MSHLIKSTIQPYVPLAAYKDAQPMPTNTILQVKPHGNTCIIIPPYAQLIATQAQRWLVAIQEATHLTQDPVFKQAQGVVLDLKTVEHMDSLAIKAIFALNELCKAHNKPLVIEVPIHPVTRLLHHCKLDQLIPVREA
jgi:anti-anti-sigma factor